MTEQEMIDYVMDTFDFTKVAKTMELLNWTWASCDGIPDEYTLRTTVRKQLWKHLNEHKSEPDFTSSSGGFEYHIMRELGKVVFIDLKFVVCESECDVTWKV